MDEEITQADFVDWKKHPFTKKFLNYLKELRDFHADMIVTEGCLKGGIETNESLAKNIGIIGLADVILNMEYDEVG